MLKTSASLAPSEQQPQIESGNDAGYRPGEKLQPQRIDELTHQPTIACKQHERKHRKRQLQDHLAETSKFPVLLAKDNDADQGRNNGGESQIKRRSQGGKQLQNPPSQFAPPTLRSGLSFVRMRVTPGQK